MALSGLANTRLGFPAYVQRTYLIFNILYVRIINRLEIIMLSVLHREREIEIGREEKKGKR